MMRWDDDERNEKENLIFSVHDDLTSFLRDGISSSSFKMVDRLGSICVYQILWVSIWDGVDQRIGLGFRLFLKMVESGEEALCLLINTTF